MKLALIQFNPTVGALKDNVERMVEFYDRADRQGVDLVIFPEMSVTGYPIEDLAESRHFVEATTRATELFLDRITGRAGVLFGTMIDNGENRKPSNGAILFDPLDPMDRQIVRKYELPNYGVFDEKRIFEPASANELWTRGFRGGQLGIMICEDGWFDTVTDELLKAGAEVLISLNGSPYEIDKGWTRIRVMQERRARADLPIPLVYVNLVGGQDELVFDGGSFVLDRNGLTQFPSFEEGMKIVDLDPQTRAKPTAGTATMRALETLRKSGDNSIEALMQAFADAGATVLHSDASGTRQAEPRTEPEIDTSDIPEMGEEFFAKAKLRLPDQTESIYRACVLGLRDYARKQGFGSVVLGMSGGVDSGIVAAMACDAFGADNVHLVRLPSRYSSEGSLADAAAAQQRLGARMRTIEIEPTVEALRKAYATARYTANSYAPRRLTHTARLYAVEHEMSLMTEEFKQAFLRGEHDDDPRTKLWLAGRNPALYGVADENIQARARGTILMAISNQEGHLLLTTGNKSEVSVGYCTLYGDMSGGFNPIKDAYKTTVWRLCRWRNQLTHDDLMWLGFLGRATEVVPEEIISKPPSAELRPDQKDADSLPPYEVLDDILQRMIEKRQSTREIAVHHPREVVERVRTLVDRAEYKRRQSAPGVKLTSKLHSKERRVPIVNHFSPDQEW